MTTPQASNPVVVVAHYAEAQEAPAMSCQAHILVVVLCPALSTGAVVMVVVGQHHRARSRLRGCWSSTSRLLQGNGVSKKHASKRKSYKDDIKNCKKEILKPDLKGTGACAMMRSCGGPIGCDQHP